MKRACTGAAAAACTVLAALWLAACGGSAHDGAAAGARSGPGDGGSAGGQSGACAAACGGASGSGAAVSGSGGRGGVPADAGGPRDDDAGDASDASGAAPPGPVPDGGGPSPIVSPPEVVGVLVGPDAVYPQNHVQLYGTDLGFPVVHDEKLFLLFGDSLDTGESICEAPENDDALGTLPLEFDGDVPELEMVRGAATPNAYARVTLIRSEQSQQLGVGQVPIGGFVDGGRLFALFNRLQFERCVSDEAGTRCPSGAGFACTQRVGVCEPTRNVVIPPLCDRDNGSGCFVGQSCAAADPGFCTDLTSSQNDGSVAGEIASVVQTLELGIARAEDPSVFDYAAAFATNKFVNPWLRTVAGWSGRRAGNDYRPGDAALLVFGRPGFVGEGGRQVQLYLMVQPLPIAVDSAGTAALSPVYFAGLDASGEPRWSDAQGEAQPIALDGRAGGDPHEPLHLINQMSVSWLGEPVNKWVMLYGGDISELLVLDAAALRDGPSPGSVVMRFADHPWGPFSEPMPHLHPGEPSMAGDGYGPGGYLYHSACRDAGGLQCTAPDGERLPAAPCADALAHWDQGRLYGALILDPYTQANDAGGLDMIWTVSTWNPYHVVMMKTSFQPAAAP